MASALGARRSALGARRSALGARRFALGARRSALGARARRSALGARRSALGARRSALGARRSALGARRSALGARRSALGARRSALGARRSALGARRSDARRSALGARRSALGARRSSARRSALGARRSALGARRSALLIKVKVEQTASHHFAQVKSIAEPPFESARSDDALPTARLRAGARAGARWPVHESLYCDRTGEIGQDMRAHVNTVLSQVIVDKYILSNLYNYMLSKAPHAVEPGEAAELVPAPGEVPHRPGAVRVGEDEARGARQGGGGVRARRSRGVRSGR